MPREPIERAKNRAYDLLARNNADLESGRITEEEWYARGDAVITPAYLAGDNPRAQSGQSGDEAHWRQARSIVCDAIHHSGTFLDLGCASGYLMESIRRWAGETGLEVEPYGLDISPQLAALARTRLPEWADRIYVGNAIRWDPPFRFDFVRTGLEYVPPARQPDLIGRILETAVGPGGRLIIGTYNEEKTALPEGETIEDLVGSWGFTVAGRSERPHFHDDRLLYRIIWLEAPAG